MTKKILILNEDGTVDSKKETKISKDDICNAKYFLVSTNEYAKNYAIVYPSKYNIFDRAIIDYQMGVAYPDHESYSYVEYLPLNPVHVETTSLSDVICLLNSIDRLDVTNFVMTGDNIMDDFTCLAIVYFGLTLILDGKVIYDEHYTLKGTSSCIYDSYKVAKCFDKIYTPLLTKKLISKKKRIYLYSDDDCIRWDYTSNKKCNLIGIPLGSNTITFCDNILYSKIFSYKRIQLDICIYYEKESFIARVSESIVNGYFEKDAPSIIDNMNDIFYVDTYYLAMRSENMYQLIDIMSHIVFVLSSIHLMYSELYIGHYEEYDVDTVLTFTLYQNDDHGKQFSINQYSIIDLETVLLNI